MPTVPRRFIGIAILTFASLALTGCQATYDDTKGWANRVEASLLEAMEETPEDQRQEPEEDRVRRQESGQTWAEAEASAWHQEATEPGAVQQAAAQILAEPAKRETAPPIAAAPEVDGSPAKAQPAVGETASADRSNQGVDPTGPEYTAVAPPTQPRPKLKPINGTAQSPASQRDETKKNTAPAPVLMIHLSSLRSESAAKKEWQTLKRAFPEHLSAMAPSFRRTEIAERGVFYRVLVGPVASRQAASRICSALKSKKQYCQVMSATPTA